MKCEQFKNLIRETPNLENLDQVQELASHLTTCQSCKSFLAYEKTLRKSFANIAEEAPPAQLAAKIFAIQTQNGPESAGLSEPGLFESFKIFFSGFPLKTAFASCMLGFLLAVLLLPQQQNTQNLQKPVELGRAQTESRPIAQELPKTSTESNKNENLVIAKTVMPDPQKPLPKSLAKDFSGAQASDEHIPGAISFSLAEDKSVRIESESDSQIQGPAPTLAASRKRAEILPSRENFIEDSFIKSEEKFVDPETNLTDKRCGELESLINNYELQIPPGFLNLTNLAAQGVIESTKLSYFSPPPGMNWYLQTIDGKVKITLKKEK